MIHNNRKRKVMFVKAPSNDIKEENEELNLETLESSDFLFYKRARSCLDLPRVFFVLCSCFSFVWAFS